MDPTLVQQARAALAHAGGIAGAAYLGQQLQPPRSARQIRDRLKGAPRVRYLGGGYFALQHAPFAPLLQWVEHHLHALGPTPLPHLVDLILREYPRGDGLAVRRWLQQEPGRLQRGPDNTIRLLPQRWRETSNEHLPAGRQHPPADPR